MPTSQRAHEPADELHEGTEQSGWRDGLTLRAFTVGLFLSFVTGAAGPYLTLIIQGSNPGDVYYTNPVAHFLLFILVGGVNVILGTLHRPWVFRRGELVVIYVMMAVANGTHPLIHYWVTVLSGPFYYASSENNWVNLIYPSIPDWIAPRDPEEVAAFFEGTKRGSTGITWKAWLLPLLCWLPLILSLQVATICLMVILRRQWMDRERIIYPLVQVSLAMVQDDERRSLVKPFFRSWMMWAGFAVPMIVSALEGSHNYFTFLPTIQLRTSFSLFRNAVEVPILLSFATLGFFFLINRDVALGLWVFSLFNIFQKGLYGVLGVGGEQEPVLSVWSYNIPSLVHQGMGAMIVLVLGGLWVGREHLLNVFRKAFRGASDVDDSDEILSYRWTVFGLFGSLGVMIVWLRFSGIPVIGSLVFLFFTFVVFVAITRVIIEGGVAVIYPPLVSPDAAVSAIGTSMFGPSGIVGLVFTRIWANDILNFTMPHCANGLKLSEQIGGRRRWLFWGMLGAILAGLVGGIWILLELSYRYGAINFRPAHFIWLPQYVYDYAAARISIPSGPDWWGWFHTGLGAFVTGLLMLARRYWAWWPLHPLGYPISSTFSWMAFNAFLAWLIKGVVLKYGGPRLYRVVRPFFLGLILGQYTIYGIFWVIDMHTGMVGNVLLP